MRLFFISEKRCVDESLEFARRFHFNKAAFKRLAVAEITIVGICCTSSLALSDGFHRVGVGKNHAASYWEESA